MQLAAGFDGAEDTTRGVHSLQYYITLGIIRIALDLYFEDSHPFHFAYIQYIYIYT